MINKELYMNYHFPIVILLLFSVLMFIKSSFSRDCNYQKHLTDNEVYNITAPGLFWNNQCQWEIETNKGSKIILQCPRAILPSVLKDRLHLINANQLCKLFRIPTVSTNWRFHLKAIYFSPNHMWCVEYWIFKPNPRRIVWQLVREFQ